jgi:hypothetical protein
VTPTTKDAGQDPAAPGPARGSPGGRRTSGGGAGQQLSRGAAAAAVPNLVALAAEFSYADPDERFELLVDIFVDGLARLAEAG